MCRMGPGSFWYWFHVNRCTFQEDMCRKLFCIVVPSDLEPFQFRITSLFTGVSSKIPIKYELSTTFQYSVNLKYMRVRSMSQTDRQTDKYHNEFPRFPLGNVFEHMCRMGRWSFAHWFDVNQSIFDDVMREIRLHFRSQWPLFDL